MKYLFTNIIGSFVLDDSLKIIDSVLYQNVKDFSKSGEVEEKLQAKHDSHPLPPEKYAQVLALFKEKKYVEKFHDINLAVTKKSISDSVTKDNLIMQSIANIYELDRISNILSKRLQEWHGLYFPELYERISNQERFVELVANNAKDSLIKELGIDTTMGADLSERDVKQIVILAEQIQKLFALRKEHEAYLQETMKTYCPNLLELAGVTIGAKLIELGRGLKHLAMLPASTVQLLGAEKALFRHIKTGSRSPKYGVIFSHQLIQKAPRQRKGKASRMLADKLSLCARLDFFKGEFKALEYRKELEEKLEIKTT